LFNPEPIEVQDNVSPLKKFKWRGRYFNSILKTGPERISPEWWFDDPNWRTGVRDYWKIDTETGERLWLYYAHGGLKTGGWFCQGCFS
jgi:protein ImuB